MRIAPLLLALFCVPLSSAQVSKSIKPVKPFSIAVGEPAVIGEPIWVKDITPGSMRYPYLGGDCIRLELLFNGKPVSLWPLKPVLPGGGGSGSRSIVNMIAAGCVRTGLFYPSPGMRLPLHIWFHIQQPGQYALRWTYVWSESKDDKRETKQVSSEWTTFTAKAPNSEDHEKWLRRLLEHQPANATDLAIDYIPSLVAAAPDERVLHSLAALLYSSDYAASVAAEALAFFPEDRVRTAVYELIQKKGPTDFVAHLVSWNSLGLGADANQRAEITRICFTYLRSSDPQKAAAAIEMIDFDVRGKNPTPTNPNLIAAADNEVLNAAADIAGTGFADAQRELILYMRGIKTPEGRRRLISMARSESAASEIANAALIYDHDPEARGPLLLENWEHEEMPHGIVTARSYGVTITNLTDSTVPIERELTIEKKTQNGWKQSTTIQAVTACKDRRFSSKTPISVAPHKSLAVHAWNGFLCGGQCEDACQQNLDSGPGIFRFVLVLPAEGRRISSLPFAIERP